jgi:signal transduction histidine kinase
MNESIGKRGIIITSLMYIIVPLLMAFKEFPQVSPDEATGFLLGRAFVVLVFLTYFFSALIDKFPRHYPVAFYLVGLFYAMHGQYFQPNYWLAMIELNALFPLFFSLKKQTVAGLYLIGLFAFGTAFYFFSVRFVLTGIFSESIRKDILTGVVITSLIALVSYNNLVATRIERNRLLHRFVDVGKNFSFIIHDLKGMIAAPAVYSTLLNRSFGAENAETVPDLKKTRQLAQQVEEDLQTAQKFIIETTRFVTAEFGSSADRPQTVQVSESVELVRIFLKSKLRNFELVLTGQLELRVELGNLNRVLMNAVINSIESFPKSQTVVKKKIEIACHENQLTVTDNSGNQLDAQALKKLNQSSEAPFTTKVGGSGLGTLIIRDYSAAMKAKVKFSNGPGGVLLCITFPPALVVKG